MTFGTPHSRGLITEIPINAAAGEMVKGFLVRANDWIDAIKVVTNFKESAWLGSVASTKTFDLIPPQGYQVIGIYGRFGQCCDGFGVVYTSNT